MASIQPMANSNASTSPNTLYVILHGLISTVDVKQQDFDGFIAHVLEIGDDHEYMFGSWLAEQRIPERKKGHPPLRGQLKGVNPGNPNLLLDSNSNIIVRLPDIPPDTHPSVRAVFQLPRPKQIHYFTSGKIEKMAISGAPNALAQIVGRPTQLSGIRVFEYDFVDPNALFLDANDGSHLWPDSEILVPLQNIGIAVLHIYNEPRLSLSPDEAERHSLTEINLSLAFLGVPITLSKTPVVIPALQEDELPGILPGETIPLDRRGQIGFRILRKLRNPSLSDAGPSASRGGPSGGQVCSGCQGQVG